MRLLLLGCTGFIGKELVPTLLNENHEIYIVSRKTISKLKLDLDFNKFKFFQLFLFSFVKDLCNYRIFPLVGHHMDPQIVLLFRCSKV